MVACYKGFFVLCFGVDVVWIGAFPWFFSMNGGFFSGGCMTPLLIFMGGVFCLLSVEGFVESIIRCIFS